MSQTQAPTGRVLSRRQNNLLRVLRMRQAAQSDPDRRLCWLRITNLRTVRLLVVPEADTKTWRPLLNIGTATLNALQAKGFIELGPLQELPDYARRRGGPVSGYGIRITEEGIAISD